MIDNILGRDIPFTDSQLMWEEGIKTQSGLILDAVGKPREVLSEDDKKFVNDVGGRLGNRLQWDLDHPKAWILRRSVASLVFGFGVSERDIKTAESLEMYAEACKGAKPLRGYRDSRFGIFAYIGPVPYEDPRELAEKGQTLMHPSRWVKYADMGFVFYSYRTPFWSPKIISPDGVGYEKTREGLELPPYARRQIEAILDRTEGVIAADPQLTIRR